MVEKIKIGIIGIGMTGTPMKKWFSEIKKRRRGKDLFCFDIDINKGCQDDISKADIVWICLPTPSCSDGSCDTSIVEEAISRLSDGKRVIVIKSTVPPGTVSILRQKYRQKGYILSNPEFLTEAQAWEDFIRPDRQIVAAPDEGSKKHTSLVLSLLPAASFQSPGVEGTYDFYEANSTEAEIGKYAGNVFGAIKVTFANIIAKFCEVLGADYENVRRIVSADRRIGGAWMDVDHGDYRGFGGFCFPKDMRALIVFGEKILEKLPEGKQKEVFSKALNVLKSIWDCNETLLKSQGLTVESVSSHDSEVEKIIKNHGRKRRNKNG